jgi:hypothetical protein
MKCSKCIWNYVPCTLFYFICILLLLLTRRSAHFNINHSESLNVILINMCTQVQCILLNLIYFTMHKEYSIILVWFQGTFNTDTISYSTFKILYFKQMFWSFSVHTVLYFLMFFFFWINNENMAYKLSKWNTDSTTIWHILTKTKKSSI